MVSSLRMVSRASMHHSGKRVQGFVWQAIRSMTRFCSTVSSKFWRVVGSYFFSQEVNEKSVKLAVWAASLNFLHDITLFVVDIHQIRLISLFRHISDHFHFHPILEQKRVIDLIPCRMISRWMVCVWLMIYMCMKYTVWHTVYVWRVCHRTVTVRGVLIVLILNEDYRSSSTYEK